MNLLDLTVTQLKRAAAIKEQMEALNKELRAIVSECLDMSENWPGVAYSYDLEQRARELLAKHKEKP